MENEYYFLTSRTGKHLLYIQISPVIYDDEGSYLLRWDASFPLYREQPEHTAIIDILADSVAKNYTMTERTPIIDRAWALVKKLPGLCLFYLPDYLLLKGRLSLPLKAVYERFDRKMEKNPSNFIYFGQPYCMGINTMEYQIISNEIRRKFYRFQKENLLYEVSRECFEDGLTTPALREAFVQYLYPDSRYYNISFDFPGSAGWTDLLFILRGCEVPLFYYQKSPLENLFHKT